MLDTSKIYQTKTNGALKILKYTDCFNVKVQFIETGYVCIAEAGSINKGLVKDKLRPNVLGVGFVGIGSHVASINRKSTPAYSSWKSMIERCYSAKLHARCPTYKNCTVCDEWHSFQNYAEWYFDNYIDGYELDKDIKHHGNKVYSPDTCLFVSKIENLIKSSAKTYRFISPQKNIIVVYNLSAFCKDSDVNRSSMSKVNLGKMKSHKGWLKAD